MKLKDLTMKKNTAIKTIPYKVQRKKIGKKEDPQSPTGFCEVVQHLTEISE